MYCEVMFSEKISGELPEHNRFIHETAIPYFLNSAASRHGFCAPKRPIYPAFTMLSHEEKPKGMLSGFPLSGRCTIQRDCKLPPIKAYQKALPPDTVQYIGIAADEPQATGTIKALSDFFAGQITMWPNPKRGLCAQLRSCCPRCMTSLNAGVVGFARTHQSANCGISTDTTPNSGSFCLNYRTCRINPPNVLVGGALFVR